MEHPKWKGIKTTFTKLMVGRIKSIRQTVSSMVLDKNYEDFLPRQSFPDIL